MRVGHTDSESARHFWIGKKLINYSCAPDGGGIRTSDLWISIQIPTLYQLNHPVTWTNMTSRANYYRKNIRKWSEREDELIQQLLGNSTRCFMRCCMQRPCGWHWRVRVGHTSTIWLSNRTVKSLGHPASTSRPQSLVETPECWDVRHGTPTTISSGQRANGRLDG